MTDESQVLSVENVSKSFGRLRVLSDISLDLHQGETLGLIGPNGAGKTTLFNIITGFLKPTAGSMTCLGRDITHLTPEQRVRHGLVRTFQKSMVFPDLSVRENIALAVRARRSSGYRWWGTAREIAVANEQAEALLGRSGLKAEADGTVRNLSYGKQRMVDILVALALEPRLLLLDEPTAGLAREEADRFLRMIRLHDSRASVILIAHDLDVVFSSCERIAVLAHGELIAVDAPLAIRRHAGVRAAYLGVEAGAA